MACRGCSSVSGCQCTVTGNGVSTSVTGSGSVASPYIVGFSGSGWLGTVTVDDATDFCVSLDNPRVLVHLDGGNLRLVPLPCLEEILPTGGQEGYALVKQSATDYDYDWAAVTGADGADGGFGNGFAFTFSTTATDADPGAGTMRFNNASYASVTEMYVDLTDHSGSTITAWLDSLDDSASVFKGRIRVRSRDLPANWAEYKLTGVTTATGYRKLVVTYVAHAGALTTTPGDTLVTFTENGDPADDEVFVLDVSRDETTVLTTGTAAYRFRMPYSMTLNAGAAGVKMSLSTASSSGTPTVDINVNGSTILSTKLTVDVSETTSATAAVPPVISSTALAADDEITIDVDLAGTGATGLKVYLIGTR